MDEMSDEEKEKASRFIELSLSLILKGFDVGDAEKTGACKTIRIHDPFLV